MERSGGYAPHQDEDISDSGSFPHAADFDNGDSDWSSDRKDGACPSTSTSTAHAVIYMRSFLPRTKTLRTIDAGVEPDNTSNLACLPLTSSSGLAGPSKHKGRQSIRAFSRQTPTVSRPRAVLCPWLRHPDRLLLRQHSPAPCARKRCSASCLS